MEIAHCLANPTIALNIFTYLSSNDIKQCSLVCLSWYWAVRRNADRLCIKVTPDFQYVIKSVDKLSFVDYVRTDYKYANEIHVIDRDFIRQELYGEIIAARLPRVRKLTLEGRGCWLSCRCQDNQRENSIVLYDPNKIGNDLTQLTHLRIGEKFTISACALLDLISRSPKLRTVHFKGAITNSDHAQSFSTRMFYSNIEKLFWPIPKKKHIFAILMIARRNENITTVCLSLSVASQLLSADVLPRVKYLSLYLLEDWKCKKGEHQKFHRFIDNAKYISSARDVEALEIRTFDLPSREELDDPTASSRFFENFKIEVWKNVAQLQKLNYLAVYGGWEMEKVCQQLAKNTLQIQYFKANLTPISVIEALDAGDDQPVLAMHEGLKNLKSLTRLRAMDFDCSDKLGNIDIKTIQAISQDLAEQTWAFNIKVNYTDEVEQFLTNILKRGSQSARSYVMDLHITPKDTTLCDLIVPLVLRNYANRGLKSIIQSTAEKAIAERGSKGYSHIALYGIRQVSNWKDEKSYQQIRDSWAFYNSELNPTNMNS